MSNGTEDLLGIFTPAAALNESGRFKNLIFCGDKRVFIVNYDSTVILKFNTKSVFNPPIAFKADDYDSPHFREENGKVIFTKYGEEFTRQKVCGKPDMSYVDAASLWQRLNTGADVLPHRGSFTLHRATQALLDDNLSHIELQGKDGKLQIFQRDVFSGSVISLTAPSSENTMFNQAEIHGDKVPDFSPVGIRMADLAALFYFNDSIRFYIPKKSGYLLFEGYNNGILFSEGALAWCLYDEMGTVDYIVEVNENGNKEIEQPQPVHKPTRIAIKK